MKKIPLHGKYGKGRYALVDDEDYDLVKDIRWHARPIRIGRSVVHYVAGRLEGNRVDMHRLIMSPPDDLTVHHINSNPLDNRKTNLRICSMRENVREGTVSRPAKRDYTILRRCHFRGTAYDVAMAKGSTQLLLIVHFEGQKLIHRCASICGCHVKARAHINVLLAERHESKAA